MAGYDDTKQKILNTLMQRASGTEIQPDAHQDFALNLLEYIRSVELISGSTLIGVADSDTVPVQSDDSNEAYIAGVAQQKNVTFTNFVDVNGNAITVSTGEDEAKLVVLTWNRQYWTKQEIVANIISQADKANFYYSYNVKKTYSSISEMNADKSSPIGVDGKYIKIGDIVTVVNNGIYSYEGATNDWKFQSSFNFELSQSVGDNPNIAISQSKYTTDLYSYSISLLEFGHGHTGGAHVINSGWCEFIPSTKKGTLKSINLPDFTGGSISATIAVIDSDKKIKSKTSVTLLGTTNDISSYNIPIDIGEYVGIYSTNIETILEYSTGDGSGVGMFTSNAAIGSSLSINPSASAFALRYSFVVAYKVYSEKKADKNEVAPLIENNNLLEEFKSDKVESYKYGSLGGGAILVRTLYCSGEVYNGPDNSQIKNLTLCSTATANGSIKVGICQVTNDVATLISLYTIPYISGDLILDLSSYNITIDNGQSIALYGDNTAILKWINSSNKCYRFSSTLLGAQSDSGYVASITLFGLFNIIKKSKILAINTNIEKLNINNAHTLMITGSSLSESLVVPNGIGWQERINDMCDIPIVNAALGGKNIMHDMLQIATDIPLPHDSLAITKDCNPLYILWLNSANADSKIINGFNGIKLFKQAKITSERIGSEMIVGDEEYWYAGGMPHEQTVLAFGYTYKVPFSVMTEIFSKCYPNYTYSGFVYSYHANWRAIAPYIKHYDDLIKFLPIDKTIKMFRPRPTYKGGSPSVNDLIYDTSEQRFEKFVSISAGNGTQNGIDTGNCDNIDNHSYNVVGGINTGISTSETSVLMRGGDITFNNYALIEFITNQINVSNVDFSIKSNISPDAIYVAKIEDTQYSESGLPFPATTFEQVEFTYSNGIVTANFDGKIQQYDKIRVLIKKTGQFSLSTPEITWNSTIDKKLNELSFTERKHGQELLSNTDVANNWTLGGNSIIKSFPTSIAQYSDYNSVKSHVELIDENDSITRTIAITQPCSKLAIRICAQQFYKIATTRFNSDTETLNSGYVANDAPQIVPYDFDYGRIKITINGSMCYYRTIMQGWSESYIEVPLFQSDNSLTIKIEKFSLIDSSYNNHLRPIMIHNVSIQKID